uniref:Uncharacterized protein n=1 Tax=Glossina austeni TaxID=7395 RepID=A0A1A9VS34_GLOAU
MKLKIQKYLFAAQFSCYSAGFLLLSITSNVLCLASGLHRLHIFNTALSGANLSTLNVCCNTDLTLIILIGRSKSLELRSSLQAFNASEHCHSLWQENRFLKLNQYSADALERR